MFERRLNNIVVVISLVLSGLVLTFDSTAYEKFANPVIFIHGLDSSAVTWKDFGIILKQNSEKNRLIVGGCVTFNRNSGGLIQGIAVEGLCESTTHAVSQGDFYLMQFSDNRNLSFLKQAEELQAIINEVSSVNGQAKVILVAHSMGGLAARSYLQRLDPTANKVLKLITVGTPHMGADTARLCEKFDDCNSVAVTQLDSGSVSLKILNDLVQSPLPSQVSYTSIIGVGGTFVIGDGDGIVSASSQNLGAVIEMNVGVHLHHTAKSINVKQCHIFDIIAEVHTCETSDTNILTEILYQIYECDTLNSSDSVFAGFGVPWNVFNPTELILKAFCSKSDIGAHVDPATYIYNQGYALVNNQWQQTTFSCTDGNLVSGVWCPKSASATLPNNSTFYVAYICNWTGTKWNCGCRDQACTQNFWQLQGIQR